ncbi:Glu/Leu/Phe/Val dehydrogenase dimerization domain-containing protein [Streptomyces sp. NPDC006992]|uniref:Glu/Leu/Phe/Val dehydrogenase dimerization domain-containing protein n=1 Tax=unclassified Streptomyces TaxID=2593676 RepID=UPI0033C40D49
MTQNAVDTPLQAAEHEPFLQVMWRDSETTARGYVVIDQLVSGIATGGLRMRPGCTLDEVGALAREMTLKMGAFGIPVGGAKGGIDFDSADPRADGVRERFLQGVRPLLERFWVTAGDLGTQQDELDSAFGRVGLGDTSFHAAMVRAPDEEEARERVRQAFATRTDGLKLSELVGGFGVAEAALAALEHRGIPASSARAVIQGFGTMGGATALYLARAGVKIVGVTDAQGLVRNPSRGVDVEGLLRARSTSGVIDRSALRDDDEVCPGDAWLDQEVDVLVPAAVSYVITEENCHRVTAELVVEAANVPTTPEAEQLLKERGVGVVPDFIANTGAAAGAWWVILGDVVSPSGACGRLASQIRPLVRELMILADETGMSMRAAGVRLAKQNSQRMIGECGAAVAFRDLFDRTAQEQQLPDAHTASALGSAPTPAPEAATDVLAAAPPNGVAPIVAELEPDTGLMETGRQPAAAFPAYWPGTADEPPARH